MFSRFNDVLQSAADVLAPPPSALHDFEYHWRQVKNFYDQHPSSPAAVPVKCHLQDTRMPFHLEQMLQILIREESTTDTKEEFPEGNVIDFVLTNRPMDLLADLATVDSPPGATVLILDWVRRYLTCLRRPSLDNESVFQPVQRLVKLCRGGRASPYETEEILFLLTVAGLIRKEPILIHLFMPSHQHSAFANTHLSASQTLRAQKMPKHNPLFDEIEDRPRVAIVAGAAEPIESPATGDKEVAAVDEPNVPTQSATEFVCDCAEDEDRLALLDTILGYVESSDTLVILRACEAALILATLSTVSATECAAIKSSLIAFGSQIGNRLTSLCTEIPDDMNTGDIEDCTVSWGLVPRDSDAQHFVGRAQLCEFLGWLDYANCLAKECSPVLTGHMCAYVRTALLEGVIEPSMVDGNAGFMLVLAAKIVHQLDAKHFSAELANWLVGGNNNKQFESNDCLLNIIIENAYENSDIFLPTMQFVESLLDNANEHILHEMLFRYVNCRGYYDATASNQSVQSWSDEEDERTSSSQVHVRSRTLAPTNILKVINNFLLLLPRQIMTTKAGGTCYEEYVQDASVHYQKWINRTSTFDWPLEASFPPDRHDSSPSNRSVRCPALPASGPSDAKCNDSGICEETFYEGPLLRLLFYYVQTMASHASELNLAAIAILSKLAFLPHPFLHEILLNPEIPVARGTNTLWTSMQSQARQLLLEVPRQEGFQRKVADTARRLLTHPSDSSDDTTASDENDPVFESIVVLEEFCKELAAIAFVKYHYATES